MTQHFKILRTSLLLTAIAMVGWTGLAAAQPTGYSATQPSDNAFRSEIQEIRIAQLSLPNLNWSHTREDPYSYAKKNSPAGGAPVNACMESAKAIPKTGNPVIDTRCSLVAFEVCMHKAIGTISQSQDSKKQCAIMQGMGGPSACQQPCLEAAALPVGGGETISTKEGTYTGLTPFAASCYNNVVKHDGGTLSACGRNEALQCLINGSSSAVVNEAIRNERKNACADLHTKYPNHACTACAKGEPRVDFNSKKIDLDAVHCNPALAAAGQCVMTTR